MTNPATWSADPFGRHELRYWDGTQWTAHVSDNGAQGTDEPVGEVVVRAAAPAGDTWQDRLKRAAEDVGHQAQELADKAQAELAKKQAERAATAASAPSATPPAGDVADQLRKLAALRDDGILTEEEFAAQKQRLLAP